jgi:hypothetical protein
MLALEQYPKTIAEIQRLMLDFDKQIRQTAETLALIDNQIDLKIVNDPNLKNDGQRKAQRDNLRQTDPIRLKAIDLLNRLTDRRTAQEIDLEYYRSEFKLLLLQLRERVASIESAA